MSRMPTHYETLSVMPDAQTAVIRAAYKALAQQYHPDKNQGSVDAADKMQALNAAYEVLADVGERRRYDLWLQHEGRGYSTRPRTPDGKGAGHPKDGRAEPVQKSAQKSVTAPFFIHLGFCSAIALGLWLLVLSVINN